MDVGDKAPDFTLPDQEGRQVRLSDLLQENKAVVVFFYPKDGSPVCSREACSFRDNYGKFAKSGAAVLGVSSDGENAHRDFAESNHLPFPLLADAGGKVRSLWDVPRTMGLFPGRVTYVLDASGVVRNVYSSQLAAEKHVSTALEAVTKLLS